MRLRWTNAQQARVSAREKGGTESVEAAATTETGDGATTDATTPSGDPISGAAASSSGTAAAVGQSSSAKTATGGPRPCAAASKETGVTADKLTIGSISTLSGPAPGIGASSAAACAAHVAYRNATGGVCGRKVVLKEADDGFDSGRYRTIITELSAQVLGLTGGFAGGDIGAHDIIQEKKLPIVNIPSSDTLNDLPTLFDMNPQYRNLDTAIGKYKYLYESGARKVSAVYLAVDQSCAEAQIQQRLMKAAGLQIVQVQELPLSTLSYDSSARGVANSGADYLFFIGTADSNVSMARSMADTGYKLKFAEYFVFSYGTNFAQQAGAAGEGAMSWLRTLPNEDRRKRRDGGLRGVDGTGGAGRAQGRVCRRRVGRRQGILRLAVQHPWRHHSGSARGRAAGHKDVQRRGNDAADFPW